eukprot:7230390-Ditylum_brightwellii.AAC.1
MILLLDDISTYAENLDRHCRLQQPIFPSKILRSHQLDLFMFFSQAKSSLHPVEPPSFSDLRRQILTKAPSDAPLPPQLQAFFHATYSPAPSPASAPAPAPSPNTPRAGGPDPWNGDPRTKVSANFAL